MKPADFRSLIAVLLLLQVTGSILNKGLYAHLHRLDNGLIIGHAHPHAQGPFTQFPDHQHEQSELLLFDLICHAAYVIPCFILPFLLLIQQTIVRIRHLIPQLLNTLQPGSNFFRGPPCCYKFML